MEVFGKTLSAEGLASIASLLLALVFWSFVLRNHLRSKRWMQEALERRQEEIERQRAQASPKSPSQDTDNSPPRGPWG